MKSKEVSEEDMELLRKSGLSRSLKRTIKEKLERGEIDEPEKKAVIANALSPPQTGNETAAVKPS